MVVGCHYSCVYASCISGYSSFLNFSVVIFAPSSMDESVPVSIDLWLGTTTCEKGSSRRRIMCVDFVLRI